MGASLALVAVSALGIIVGSVIGDYVPLIWVKRVAALSGRVHVYEGHPMATVVFAVRVMARLGVPALLLTNAAGGINTNFGQGALMVIDDHINLMGSNPLIGANDERMGPRFPDMSEVDSYRLRGTADEAAAAAGVEVRHGGYLAVHAARHMGMEVLGISCITNMAAGVLNQTLVHDEVMETARRVRGSFIALLEGIIARL